jgi:hypothetical protein
MIVVTLACGDSRTLDNRESVGVGHNCYCPVHKTYSHIVSMTIPPRQPRPVVDSMLSCVLQMLKDVQQINQTGDTWENILARAKTRSYDDLDAIAGPPCHDNPAPPPVDYESEYFKLYNNVMLMCQTLGFLPSTEVKQIDMNVMQQEAAALIARIHDLQHFVAPPAGVHWGADWNSTVYKINHLVKP